MPELRKDPILGRWVIIATERGKRPTDFDAEPQPRRGGFCPFDYGSEDKTPSEVLAYRDAGSSANQPGWWLRVIPNKFPALQIEGELNRAGDGMYDYMNGIGAHEVVVETPDHNGTLDTLSVKQVQEILWAYRDRLIDLKKDPRFRYIIIFKNHGAAAGASLEHPHSQIIAMPIIPKRVQEEITGARQYFEYKERCVFCDILRQEKSSDKRIVLENENFISFMPFASRFPFETWLMPKVHQSHFEDIRKKEVMSLAEVLREVIRRIKVALNDPPYNFILHNSPCREKDLEYYHWHLEIMPKLTKVAGFEWGTGFYINPTPPEDAARYLREIGG
jgi:UDPglucose--hexose-1-phosphate uridylyltransferase